MFFENRLFALRAFNIIHQMVCHPNSLARIRRRVFPETLHDGEIHVLLLCVPNIHVTYLSRARIWMVWQNNNRTTHARACWRGCRRSILGPLKPIIIVPIIIMDIAFSDLSSFLFVVCWPAPSVVWLRRGLI